MIEPGSRVLDLGCGDGRLLSLLKARRGIRGVGVDISIESVIDVLDAGHDILQGDIDAGLATIPAGSYDYAILSETLQVVRKPRFVLGEMLRVARYGIVSFPNFAKWSLRLQLGLRGRMPKGKSLPFEWYDTPNIHLFTLKDFGALCREDGIRILQVHCVPDSPIGALLVRMQCCNLGADRVLVKIAREET
jgi:methionine biosynthesis protein MetW